MFTDPITQCFGDQAMGKSDDKDYDGYDLNTLRRKLSDRGLDVDGTREMLVSSILEKNYAKRREG